MLISILVISRRTLDSWSRENPHAISPISPAHRENSEMRLQRTVEVINGEPSMFRPMQLNRGTCRCQLSRCSWGVPILEMIEPNSCLDQSAGRVRGTGARPCEASIANRALKNKLSWAEFRSATSGFCGHSGYFLACFSYMTHMKLPTNGFHPGAGSFSGKGNCSAGYQRYRCSRILPAASYTYSSGTPVGMLSSMTSSFDRLSSFMTMDRRLLP